MLGKCGSPRHTTPFTENVNNCACVREGERDGKERERGRERGRKRKRKGETEREREREREGEGREMERERAVLQETGTLRFSILLD